MSVEGISSIALANPTRDPVKLEKSDREKKFQLANLIGTISITQRLLDTLKKAQELKKNPHVDS